MVSITKWGSSLVRGGSKTVSRPVLVAFVVAAFLVSGFFAPNAQAAVSSVTIISPSITGLIWGGGVKNITWTVTGDPTGVLADIALVTVDSGGIETGSFEIATDVSLSSFSFPWPVGILSDSTVVPDGANYKIKLLKGSTVYDLSDEKFTIDNTLPVLNSITSVVSDATPTGVLQIGDSITFTVSATTTEPNATVVGSYNGAPLTWSTVDGGITYTATYTVTEGNADQTAPLQISGVTMEDQADPGNVSSPGSGSDVTVTIDATRPTLTSRHIQSDNTNNQYAKTGNTITLSFTSSEAINTPTVTIAGNAAVVVGGLTSWSATYTMTGAETEGQVPFTIDFSDVAGNTGVQVIATSDLSSVTFDKTAPTISSITTKDSDFDGDIETATIVFDGAVDDSTFAAGNFTIGGFTATGLVSGTADDNTFDVVIPTGVAGTNVKQVNYTPGSGADMAGNILAIVADGDVVEVDGAGPVMMSAVTTSTTTINVTFSEDLNGVTITNADFTVVESTLTAPDAFEVSPGVVTLTTLNPFGTGSTPLISLVGSVTDLPSAGSNPSPSGQTITPDDGVAPTILSVTSSTLDDSYNNPDGINITVNFSEAVTSIGSVTVTLDTTGSCTFSVANSTTGSCTYIIADGENSSDLTTTLIAGVIADQALNAMADFTPASNLGVTSNIVVDTTEPSAFTVGEVFTRGGTEVASYWNGTNTSVDVIVPVAIDTSLIGGTIQLQAKADGSYVNVGLPFPITLGSLDTSIFYPISATNLEAISGFSEGNIITFTAIITDLAGNPTTGTPSINTLTVDQIAPSVYAGTDKEVNATVFQDTLTSDLAPSSGIASYIWTQQSGPFGGTVSVTPIIDGDANLSANVDGTYVLRLTVTDNAGNSASDEMTLIWDTVVPVMVFSIPNDSALDVSIADGNLSAVFSEDIVWLLNASMVTLVEHPTGPSHLGVVSVQGGDGNSAVLLLPYSGLVNSTLY